MNLYLDEVGALKKLPANKRASGLASVCGFGAGVPFYGDMFVGRVRRSEGRLWNVDFGLEDTRPESSWVRAAPAQNSAQQQQEAPLRGPSVSAEELTNVSGEGDGYSWEQQGEEVVVTVPVPAGTRGKDCKVTINKRMVIVDLAATAPAGFKKLQLVLYAAVAASEGVWCFDGDSILVTLIKVDVDETWPTLILPES